MASTKPEATLHFLLRYSDRLYNVDTFTEHKAVEREHGSVWWGKFGMGCKRSIIETARKQIKAGTATYLYLARESSLEYRGRIVQVIGGGAGKRYSAPDRELMPSYYRKEPCGVWFRLVNLVRAKPPVLVLYNDPSSRPTFEGARSLVYVTEKRRLV